MIRIVPAIDIINGQVVRLTHGRFDKKTVYNNDPLEVAKIYQDNGIKYLHLVDLDGARAGRIINHKIVEKIATMTGLNIDFGGGIRSEDDVKLAINCGVNQITVGSVAVTNKEHVISWIRTYGAEKFILGADVIDKKIAVAAWQDKTQVDIFHFLADYKKSGINSCICTDVGRDGALTGPAHDLYNEIKLKYPQLFLIASGGVSHIDDVEQLNNDGIDAVIIGKALYEGNIKPEDLKAYLC
jgi:phosphoribosylformimino-5-aminoimidazole carboxamide ribotide isomerase